MARTFSVSSDFWLRPILTNYLISVANNLGNQAQLGLWTSVELNIDVIAACLPTMQPLLRTILRGLNSARSQLSKFCKSSHKSSWHGRSESRAHRRHAPPTGFIQLKDSKDQRDGGEAEDGEVSLNAIKVNKDLEKSDNRQA